LLTVTLAFAIAAPVGSVTAPVNWPFCTCATALKVRASTANTARQNCNLFILPTPSGDRGVWFLKYARKFVLRILVVKACREPLLPTLDAVRTLTIPSTEKHISRVIASPATVKCAEFCATNYCFVNHVAD